MKRWLLALVILVVTGLVGGAGYLGAQSVGASHAEPPAPPQTVPVTRGNVQQTVTAPGELVGTRHVALGLDVRGELYALHLRPGDRVAAGQVLARLEGGPFEDALHRAELSFSLARAEHARQLADAELAVEAARLERQEAQESRERQLVAAEAAVQLAKVRLAQARLQYPDLTAVEIRLNQAAAEEAYAADEYRRALDRPWEPASVRDGLLRAWHASKDALAIAQAEYRAALKGQGVEDHDLALLRADLERAEAELARLQVMTDARLLLGLQSAEKALADLRARGVDPFLQLAVEEARANLQALTVVAPFDGVVLEVRARNGETVDPGTPIVVLYDPGVLEIAGSVTEEDIPLIVQGQSVDLFFDAAPDEMLMGVVARIVPARLPGDHPRYLVYIAPRGPLPPALLPGMTVDASVIVARRSDALRLPRSLVKTRSDDTATVEVWSGSAVETRTVQVGLRGDAYVEIVSGLREGDQVVVE